MQPISIGRVIKNEFWKKGQELLDSDDPYLDLGAEAMQRKKPYIEFLETGVTPVK